MKCQRTGLLMKFPVVSGGESPMGWWKYGEALTSPIGRVSLP
jgi:hypothetical protein